MQISDSKSHKSVTPTNNRNLNNKQQLKREEVEQKKERDPKKTLDNKAKKSYDKNPSSKFNIWRDYNFYRRNKAKSKSKFITFLI